MFLKALAVHHNLVYILSDLIKNEIILLASFYHCEEKMNNSTRLTGKIPLREPMTHGKINNIMNTCY